MADGSAPSALRTSRHPPPGPTPRPEQLRVRASSIPGHRALAPLVRRVGESRRAPRALRARATFVRVETRGDRSRVRARVDRGVRLVGDVWIEHASQQPISFVAAEGHGGNRDVARRDPTQLSAAPSAKSVLTMMAATAPRALARQRLLTEETRAPSGDAHRASHLVGVDQRAARLDVPVPIVVLLPLEHQSRRRRS